MAQEVSKVGFGLVHPSPMDLEGSQSPEVSAQCGPHSWKPYQYDCLAKESENMKLIIKIEMGAHFEL